MQVFVLLFNAGTDNEGIHSIRLLGSDGREHNVVMMFESADDAERYALLLEAQDFQVPTVEEFPAEDIEEFCEGARYEAKLIPRGFTPKSAEDRVFLAPPERNAENPDWSEDDDPRDRPAASGAAPADNAADNTVSSELDDFRRRLEGLL
ncbi:MAG: DUF3110 domain-containing protein [Geitlerinemataceae cyanobacterium]